MSGCLLLIREIQFASFRFSQDIQSFISDVTSFICVGGVRCRSDLICYNPLSLHVGNSGIEFRVPDELSTRKQERVKFATILFAIVKNKSKERNFNFWKGLGTSIRLTSCFNCNLLNFRSRESICTFPGVVS